MPAAPARLRRFLAVVFAAGVAACGTDPVAPDPTSGLAGTYTQRTFAPDWWAEESPDFYDPARTTHEVTLARDGGAIMIRASHYQKSGRVTRDTIPSRWAAGGDSVSVVANTPLITTDGTALRLGLWFRRAGADTLVNTDDGTLFVRRR